MANIVNKNTSLATPLGVLSHYIAHKKTWDAHAHVKKPNGTELLWIIDIPAKLERSQLPASG